MTRLARLPQGSEIRNGHASSRFPNPGPALRRYLLLSTGIASTALGLALIASVLAASYAGSTRAPGGLAMTDSPTVVSVFGDRSASSFLDPAPSAITPQGVPEAVRFEAASPAGPFDVERGPPARSAVLAASQSRSPAVDAGNRISPPGTPVTEGEMESVNITFYDCLQQGFCGLMYNGQRVYEGAAACSWNLPIGTQFAIQGDPTGRVYVCADRGLLIDTWVDVFFHDPDDGWAWQASVGRWGTIEIISLPPR